MQLRDVIIILLICALLLICFLSFFNWVSKRAYLKQKTKY